jgi:leucyl-tRNA synthetase
MLSDTPPERDIEWTEGGAEGCWRFVQRVYRLVTETPGLPEPGTEIPPVIRGPALELRRAAHRAVAWVTEDLDALRFNRAVARIYELANAIGTAPSEVEGSVHREALEILVRLISPTMPHLAESCWQALGWSSLVIDEPWPIADAALIRSDTITIAVQVDGKRRGEITIDRDADADTVRAAALDIDGVARALAGKPPRKVIVVPQRIVNVVT